MEGTPRDSEVLRAILEGRIRDIHVALPGRVDTYDREKQTADITPMVRRTMQGPEDEDDIFEDLPQLRSVPVIFPGGNDFFIAFNLAAGDTGQLVFNQWDPAGWRKSGDISNPIDFRMHHPAHATFQPGYRAMAKALAGLTADGITLGSRTGLRIIIKPSTMEVGGDSDAAALASKLDGILNVLSTWVTVPNDGGAALQTAINAWKIAHPGSTGSGKLKLGG